MLALSKSEGFRSTTTPSPSPPPDSSSRCALSVSAFGSLPSFRSAGPSDPCHSPIPSAFSPLTVNTRLRSPLFATLTDRSQLIEKPATLSPFAATLTSCVKHKSFPCHSYRKTPGVGYALPEPSKFRVSSFALPRRSPTPHFPFPV